MRTKSPATLFLQSNKKIQKITNSKPTKSPPRIENQICHLISIYNPIKEIKKITNIWYFFFTCPKTHKIKNREPNLLPFYFHSKKLQIHDISSSFVPKPTKLPPRIENQVSCHLIFIYNPIKEIQKITNIWYFLLTRPKTHKIKNREPNLLPSYFHSKKLQTHDISSSRYRPKNRHPKVSTVIITFLQSNRGKKKKKNSKTGGYNIENIIFPNPILPPSCESSVEQKISRRPRTAISRRIIVLGRYNKPNFTGSGQHRCLGHRAHGTLNRSGEEGRGEVGRSF